MQKAYCLQLLANEFSFFVVIVVVVASFHDYQQMLPCIVRESGGEISNICLSSYECNNGKGLVYLSLEYKKRFIVKRFRTLLRDPFFLFYKTK